MIPSLSPEGTCAAYPVGFQLIIFMFFLDWKGYIGVSKHSWRRGLFETSAILYLIDGCTDGRWPKVSFIFFLDILTLYPYILKYIIYIYINSWTNFFVFWVLRNLGSVNKKSKSTPIMVFCEISLKVCFWKKIQRINLNWTCFRILLRSDQFIIFFLYVNLKAI